MCSEKNILLAFLLGILIHGSALRACDFQIEDSDKLQLKDLGEGLPQSGLWRQGFDLADMNSDGLIDIIHGPPRKQTGPPQVFLQQQSGNWKKWNDLRFPEKEYHYGSTVVADFNLDGRLDLAIAMHQSEAKLLLRDQSKVFIEPTNLNFRLPPFFARGAAVSDLDMNGSPDIVLPGEGFSAIGSSSKTSSKGVRVFLNKKGELWDEETVPGTEKYFGDRIFVSSTSSTNQPEIYFLPKSLQAGIIAIHRSKTGEWEVKHYLKGVYDYLWSAANVDIDGNGSGDLIFTGSTKEGKNWISFLGLKRSNRQSGEILLSAPGRQVFRAVHFGNLNDDGVPDLVVAGNSGSLDVLVSKGRCSYSKGSFHFPYLSGCAGQMVKMKDVNGDGVDEIVSSFASESAGEGRCVSGGGITALQSG